MKKSMSIIALFIVLLISVSATTSVPSGATQVIRPSDLQLATLDSLSTRLHSLRGHYTVVHFWSSADATSRIRAIQLDRFVASTEGRLSLLSINTDLNPVISREIVRVDSLDEATQFYAGPASSATLLSLHTLDPGSQTFLLAPDGTIVAEDPTVHQLSQLIYK